MNRSAPAVVLEYVENPKWTVQDIATATGWPVDDVARLAVRHGYALNAASKKFQRAPQGKPAQAGIVRAPAAPAAKEVEPASDELVWVDAPPPARARNSSRMARVREQLRERPGQWAMIRPNSASGYAKSLLKNDEWAGFEVVSRRRPEDQPKRATVYARFVGSESAQVRAWAAANDIQCPTKGPLPQQVLDAYLDAAHGGAA
ncbi:MAG: hypothetical protein AB7H92_15640 [Microbacteriaceae bacterium]